MCCQCDKEWSSVNADKPLPSRGTSVMVVRLDCIDRDDRIDRTSAEQCTWIGTRDHVQRVLVTSLRFRVPGRDSAHTGPGNRSFSEKSVKNPKLDVKITYNSHKFESFMENNRREQWDPTFLPQWENLYVYSGKFHGLIAKKPIPGPTISSFVVVTTNINIYFSSL